MKYMLLIHAQESGWMQLSKTQQQEAMAAYMAYGEALKKSGTLLGNNRLQPIASTTTVRVANGKPQVQDGPFAETKEQLGGYYLIDVPNLDAAISWAARCPGAQYGAVEVRPIWEM